MPWRETSPMDQRVGFINDYLRSHWSMTELCARYGVSRKTGYKWIDRFKAEGFHGLADRSRRPHHSPRATRSDVVEALIAAKRRHTDRGAKKLLPPLARERPDWPWPAVSTANLILKRHGLTNPQSRRRRRQPPPLCSRTESTGPNDVWTADFKGEFRTRDGRYCYPLTILDDHSRYLLTCRALLEPSTAATKATFLRLFRTQGLPSVIRTDNGTPFAGPGLAGLSRLAVWWMRLGIHPERIAPGHPEQNGRHERLHRTLKEATAFPPAASCEAQQRRFASFRKEYNDDRPHESLGQVPPAKYYASSPRPWPNCLPPLEYPAHFELRRADSNGCISWHTRRVFLSSVLAKEYIGLEELTTGVWDVYFGSRRLGIFNEAKHEVEDIAPVRPG